MEKWKRLRILYAGNVHVPTGAEANISRELTDMGHEVFELIYPTYTQNYSLINGVLENQIKSLKPDIVLCGKVTGLKGDDIRRLKAIYNVKFVQWIFDKMEGFDEGSRTNWWYPQAPAFDIVFNSEDDQLENYRKRGINHHIQREGFNPDLYKNIKPEKEWLKKYKCMVLFAGTPYTDFRLNLIKVLDHDSNIDFKYYNKLFGHNFVKALNCGKISINTNFDDTADAGWSSRIVEHMACAIMMLAPKIPAMEKEGFVDGKNIVYYKAKDVNDLKEKIKYYMNHEDERLKIANEGMKFVNKRFTWKRRVELFMQQLEKEGIY